MNTFNNILFELKDNIAIVTVNRPDKLNALNQDTLTELDIIFDNIKQDNEIFSVIITGSGEKAFVAGADISQLNQLNGISALEFANYGQSVYNKIENLGKPVIAAVNGFALGGGCELALACHIRTASSNARFGQPEVSLGIIPGYGGTQRLPRIINQGLALEMILTGDMINAEEAYRIGLVNKVFEREELLEKTTEIAKKLNAKGQIAIRASLDAVVNGAGMSLKDALTYEASLFALSCTTEDFKEGTSAFLQKRKPEFKNK